MACPIALDLNLQRDRSLVSTGGRRKAVVDPSALATRIEVEGKGESKFVKVKSVRKKLEVTILERGEKREAKEEELKFSVVKEVVSDSGPRLKVIGSLFEEVEEDG